MFSSPLTCLNAKKLPLSSQKQVTIPGQSDAPKRQKAPKRCVNEKEDGNEFRLSVMKEQWKNVASKTVAFSFTITYSKNEEPMVFNVTQNRDMKSLTKMFKKAFNFNKDEYKILLNRFRKSCARAIAGEPPKIFSFEFPSKLSPAATKAALMKIMEAEDNVESQDDSRKLIIKRFGENRKIMLHVDLDCDMWRIRQFVSAAMKLPINSILMLYNGRFADNWHTVEVLQIKNLACLKVCTKKEYAERMWEVLLTI